MEYLVLTLIGGSILFIVFLLLPIKLSLFQKVLFVLISIGFAYLFLGLHIVLSVWQAGLILFLLILLTAVFMTKFVNKKAKGESAAKEKQQPQKKAPLGIQENEKGIAQLSPAVVNEVKADLTTSNKDQTETKEQKLDEIKVVSNEKMTSVANEEVVNEFLDVKEIGTDLLKVEQLTAAAATDQELSNEEKRTNNDDEEAVVQGELNNHSEDEYVESAITEEKENELEPLHELGGKMAAIEEDIDEIGQEEAEEMQEEVEAHQEAELTQEEEYQEVELAEEEVEEHQEAELAQEEVEEHQEAELAQDEVEEHQEAELAQEEVEEHQEAELAQEEVEAHQEAELAQDEVEEHQEAELAQEEVEEHQEAELAQEEVEAHQEAKLVQEEVEAHQEEELVEKLNIHSSEDETDEINADIQDNDEITSKEVAVTVTEDTDTSTLHIAPVPRQVNRELMDTLVGQLLVYKKHLNIHDFEQLVLDYAKEGLHDNDYYLFASILRDHYIETEQFDKLKNLLIKLKQRYNNKMVIKEEITFFERKFLETNDKFHGKMT